MRGKKGLHSIWDIVCRDKYGNIKWGELNVHNLLHDEGEESILKAIFSKTYTVTANDFIGLDDRVTIAEADTLSSLSDEPAVGGYARQPIATNAVDFTISQDSGDWQAVTKIVTFTPSGTNYPSVRNMFLCDVVSGVGGKLFASVALSQARVVLDGDSLDINLTIKLTE